MNEALLKLDILFKNLGINTFSIENAPEKRIMEFEWGKIHTIEWKHPVSSLSIGPFPFQGSWNTVFIGGFYPHPDVDPKKPMNYPTTYFSSMKTIHNLGEKNKWRSSMHPGYSCHVSSPNNWFANGVDNFLNKKTSESYISNEEVEKNTFATLSFKFISEDE